MKGQIPLFTVRGKAYSEEAGARDVRIAVFEHLAHTLHVFEGMNHKPLEKCG